MLAIKKFFSLILVFFMMNFSSLFGNDKAEIKKISDNLTDAMISGTMSPFSQSDIPDADKLLQLVTEDENGNYYFTDIDYTDPENATWPAAKHLTRTERLALYFRLEQNDEMKVVYKNTVLKLLDHWIDKDYQNDNWWHNKLSDPNIIGETAILMKSELSKNQLFKLTELVGRGSFTIDPTLLVYTGANAVDISMSTIKFGVLSGSSSAIESAVSVITKELGYSALEGIKKDGTYFQHGNRLYMGGYGISFVNAMANISGMLSGTKYTFSEDKLTPFASFILDGLRKMSFGSTLDPTSMGRSVSRPAAQPLTGIVSALTRLSATPEMPRKDEIYAYAKSIADDTKENYGLTFYDEAKTLVLNNSDFYFSFRGGNNLMFYSEITNNENILAYNSSFPGTTTIMHSGKEQTNIAPIYNYSLVPGTTAVYENDEELAAHKDFTYRLLPGVYGNTIKDGAAVVFVKTKHENISMTVSCFATKNAVILLGAGLKDKNGSKLYTTLDQGYFAGSYSQDGNTVIHNGIKYTLIEGGELSASNEHRTGSWRRNNLTLPDVYEEGDVFTIFTECNGSYAYSVMSENTEAEFEVIQNDEKIQAVKLPDGRIAAAFIGAGSFTYDSATYNGTIGSAKIFG